MTAVAMIGLSVNPTFGAAGGGAAAPGKTKKQLGFSTKRATTSLDNGKPSMLPQAAGKPVVLMTSNHAFAGLVGLVRDLDEGQEEAEPGWGIPARPPLQLRQEV